MIIIIIEIINTIIGIFAVSVVVDFVVHITLDLLCVWYICLLVL